MPSEKQKLGVLDFSDLEHFAIRLLEEHAAVRDRVQTQFRQILMDEYQDTNGQQARLLQLLRGRGNFYAVGDINQSIFGFRYATPEVFRRHREQVRLAGEHHVELFDNFRSRTDILRAVEAVVENADRRGIPSTPCAVAICRSNRSRVSRSLARSARQPRTPRELKPNGSRRTCWNCAAR